jgi:integrase
VASIQKRVSAANGCITWRVMYRIDGKQASDSFTDPRTAERYKRLVEQIGGQAARDSLTAHTLSGGGVPTLAEWLEHYLAHLTNATEGTVAEYRRLAKRTWLPALGHLPIDTIGRDAVRTWVGHQSRQLTKRGKPTSAKTIANAHGLLSQALAGAVEAGHITTNEAHAVALPSGTREEMVFLSHSEFARLLHATPERWRPLVVTLAGTGMRWGEATALRWGDVDLDADVPEITVTRAWKRGPTTRELGAPKTGRSRRRISLPPEVVEALRPLRAAPDAYVFTGPRGGHVHHQAFHPRVWRPAVEASGIGKRPRIHDLRHSHASWLLAAGVPLNVLQRRLGHESITTTVDTYGHVMGDAQTVAAQAASFALSAAMPKMLD